MSWVSLYLYTLLLVLVYQLMPIAERLRVIRQRAIKGTSFRCDEANRAVIEHENDDAPFVLLSMMEATEAHQVGQLRLSCPPW